MDDEPISFLDVIRGIIALLHPMIWVVWGPPIIKAILGVDDDL